MYFIMSFTFITFLTNCVSIETIKESLKDAQQKSSSQDILVPVSEKTIPLLSTLRAYRPPTDQQPHDEDNIRSHYVVFKSPHIITKIAKSRGLGFDPYYYPYIKKGYFEPFERRLKPVTLVAFRRNGFEPRKTFKVVNSESSEVAEIQSPYNDVSNFWLDGPEDFRSYLGNEIHAK